MNTALEQKLRDLPARPGVYLHKSADGEVIYVGKAAVLRNRVRQYFQDSRVRDNKTTALVAEIHDTDWIETESEVDALFLESELVKRYMPRYNILLRDDKNSLFVRIDMKADWPTVTTTRHPYDDGADYYGPFYNSYAIKQALRYLRRVYPFFERTPQPGDSRLATQIGVTPDQALGSDAYKQQLRQLVQYIKGNRKQLTRELEQAMKQAAHDEDFESAALLRNRLRAMQELTRRIMFGDREHLDISKDEALSDLVELFGLMTIPRRIEGFDISHMSGSDVVASMVVFTNGASDRAEYRKFKMSKQQNNDFDNMHETLHRRLSPKNIASWGLPDLQLIDGGKGQLDAATRARNERGQTIPMIGLAKKREQLVVVHRPGQSSSVEINQAVVSRLGGYCEFGQDFTLINLPHDSHIIKLVQRIRDESHRFAVSYHSVLKTKRQTLSAIEDIPGIGPATRRKLLRHFSSMRQVAQATDDELAGVIGQHRARLLRRYLQSN